MYRNLAQKWVVFAFDETTGIEKTGDAANITANIRIDGGAANAVDDVNPTELEDGYYVFDVTAVETNGSMLLIAPQSSTPDIQVVGAPAVQYTHANVISGIVDGPDASGNGSSCPSSLNDAPWSLATNDSLNGRILIYDPGTTTAALRNQAGTITAYNGTNGTLTFAASTFTTACATGDTFKIY